MTATGDCLFDDRRCFVFPSFFTRLIRFIIKPGESKTYWITAVEAHHRRTIVTCTLCLISAALLVVSIPFSSIFQGLTNGECLINVGFTMSKPTLQSLQSSG